MSSTHQPAGSLIDLAIVNHTKVTTEHDESVLKAEDHAIAVMPDSLRGLTTEERNQIERRVVRKIDCVVLPIIMVLYILNYIDRQNLSSAKLQNIMGDLNMNADQFSTAISILYVGYIPFQIPSNMIMTKITRPGLYICVAVVIWGIISSCTGAAQSYGGLLGVRIVLGVIEAVFFPGVIYYLSAWYTKQELGKRLAALYIGQQLGSAFGGLIAAGVLKLNGVHGIQGWRYLFIVEGVATVGIGLISCFFMPEYPHNARLLKPIERDLAVWRIEQESGVGEAHEEVSTLHGFFLALTDIKIWVLVFCVILSQALNSALNFLPTIVDTLGYDETMTLVLTAPPYLFACFYFYFLSWWSDRTGALYWPIILSLTLGVVGFVVSLATTNLGARYFAIMLFPSATIGPQIPIYKTLNLHMARPYPKRAAGVALLNAIGGTSNVWGSYLWTEGPRFYPGFGMCIGVVVAFMFTITVYKWSILNENKKLYGDESQVRRAMKGGVTQEQVDMGWRYEGY
ncbi:MFS transporter [Penicillium malachiteum]|uniref:MFS transporter n=1 Tax=Penicillium malachiteum TaxID=1324776 RepID=UPI002548D897|nr:MFS transporter [Penicillium malachiteum]KAJ5715843.1 MFS transporter [Penicillium malachiteum]